MHYLITHRNFFEVNLFFSVFLGWVSALAVLFSIFLEWVSALAAIFLEWVTPQVFS
jgi:hypothetical protein